MSGKNLLVATIENYQFPSSLPKLITAAASKFGVETRKREIVDMPFDCASKIVEFIPKSKYEFERSRLISIEKAEPVMAQSDEKNFSVSNRSSKYPLTFIDVEWSNSIVFITPTYHGMMPPRLRNLLSQLKSPSVQKLIENKPICAVTYTSDGEKSGKDVVASFYLQSMEIGAIPVAPPRTVRQEGEADVYKLAYHYSVGADFEINFLTAQIERLVKIAETFSSIL